MVGRKLSLAAVLAAVVAQLSEAGGTRYGVLAFDEQVTSVKDLDAENDISEVVERILLLPEGKATDLSQAFQAAVERTDDLPAAQTVLISDCMPTRGTTGFRELAGLAARVPSLHICYLDDRQPVIELHGSGARLNLYEWWARRWVGDQRVYNVDRLDDLDLVIEGLSAEEPRA
ncbi:MAG: AAA family ATPase, partial [Actinomycetes bacterium]